jgi:hypothetical protein
VGLVLLAMLVRAHPEVVDHVAQDTFEVVVAAAANARLLTNFAADVNLADAFPAAG